MFRSVSIRIGVSFLDSSVTSESGRKEKSSVKIQHLDRWVIVEIMHLFTFVNR